jgi:hypothetical protein
VNQNVITIAFIRKGRVCAREETRMYTKYDGVIVGVPDWIIYYG